MKVKLDFSLYKGITRLKQWWKEVLAHFTQLQEAHNALEDTVEAESEKLSTEITQRTNADIALSDRINTEAKTRMTADNTLAQDISEETEARKSSDNEIKASIAQMRVDYFGDGSTMTFEWTGDLPEPQLPLAGSEPYADFNLSGMFKLDGVPCGTMESARVLLNALGSVDEATTYIVACFNADTGEITVKDSNNYVETSVTNNICSLTVARYYIEVTPNGNGDYTFVTRTGWPYTGSAIVAKAGLSDRIERNSQAIATMQTELNDKVEKIDGMGLSSNDYTNTEKTKLAGIASGANKTVVDAELSENSENPVQNKVIKAALDNIELSNGNGIVSVEQTTTSNADGGANIITVTMSDGSISTFTVKNGSKGSTGAKGDTGTRGSQWYSGTALTGTATGTNYSYSGASNALVGDYYLNTSTGGLYRCVIAGSGTTAKWTYQGCIKGATGAAGADGQDLQAVYSTTPTQVGTWIDGSVIYRAAWSFTKAQYGTRSLTYLEDIPGIPSVIANAGDGGIIREQYGIVRDNTLITAHSFSNITDLQSYIKTYGSANDYIVYCIIEYILN